MNLDGKVAIITGSGGKGTGRAVARRRWWRWRRRLVIWQQPIGSV
jgi:NAD(P)-dependent dehydrogenase (short-subunit alcohol dehydrogenase family)